MALLTRTDELKQFVEISGGTAILTLAPSIRSAERRHIADLLGDEMYAAITDAYRTAEFDASKIAKVNLQNLLLIAQEALANIAMMLAVPRLSLSISDTGLRRSETESLKTAYQYQQLDLQESYGRAGFDALEDMLTLLEKDLPDFLPYKKSTAYTEQNKYLIRSAREFSEYFNIGQARLTFQSVRYIMKRVEDGIVKRVLGSTFFQVLSVHQKAGTLTGDYQNLLTDYVKPAIALLTISKALIERKVDVTEMGVTVSIKNSTNNVAQKNTAPNTETVAMISQLNTDADDFIRRLGDELSANSQLYPDYTSSTSGSNSFKIGNKADNGFYAV